MAKDTKKMAAARSRWRMGGKKAKAAGRVKAVRRIKHSFRDGLRAGTYAAIADGPIRPAPLEIAKNPRSRAAKLRWALKAKA
jgi:16S rRNA (cytosine1402-N4)-methyltransferase